MLWIDGVANESKQGLWTALNGAALMAPPFYEVPLAQGLRRRDGIWKGTLTTLDFPASPM